MKTKHIFFYLQIFQEPSEFLARLLNNSKSTSMSTNQSLSSSSLLPNFNRKSPLANLFNCDEIYLVNKSKTLISNS